MKTTILIGLVLTLQFANGQILPEEPEILEIMYEGDLTTIFDGQVLAKLASNVTDELLEEFVLLNGSGVIERAYGGGPWVLLGLPLGLDVMGTVDAWSDVEIFDFVGPSVAGWAGSDPNDPSFFTQWGFKNTGQDPPGGVLDADIDAEQAWDITTGSSTVLAAVLDFGLPLDLDGSTLLHPDLNETSRYLLGPDWTSDDEGVRDNDGHGTHVLGIMAAETNNSTGVAGVDWNCRVRVHQLFFGPGIFLVKWVYDAVNYEVQQGGSGAKIINLSGGVPNDVSGVLRDAVELAAANNILIVAISHNGGSIGIKYPARYAGTYSNVIAVGATNQNDVRASYSNYGPELTVAAPGGEGLQACTGESEIYSTWPTYSVNKGCQLNYAYLWGTSMAAPMVSGVASLLLAKRPMLRAEDLRFAIAGSADKVGADSYSTDRGHNEKLGHGRLNAYRALKSVIAPYYDDCGRLWDSAARQSMEPHRMQGTDNSAYGVDPNTTLSVHSTEVIYRYLGLTGFSQQGQAVGYKLRVTFYDGKYPSNPAPPDRIQDLYFDNTLIDNDRNLPDTPQQFEWVIPPATYSSDQMIDARFVKVSGPNAAVAEIWLVEYVEAGKMAINTDESSNKSISFGLSQNYPNPFNPLSIIRYELPAASQVSLKVFDLLGEEVMVLVDELKQAGFHEATVRASNLASGMYFYRLQAGSFIDTKKLLLVR